MSKLRSLTCDAVNLLMLVSLIAGLGYGIDGARNLGLFMVWLLIVMTLTIPGARQAFEKTGSPVPVEHGLARAFDVFIDLSVVAVLAWHAHNATAALYLVHFLVLGWFRGWSLEHNDKLKAKATAGVRT